MPWTRSDYPASLKNFEPRTRDKAVEIANALLKDGYNEGRAIAIATAQAKEWADDHPAHHSHSSSGSSSRDQGEGSRSGRQSNLHVVPHGGDWAIKAEGSAEPEAIYETKSEAVDKAKKMASDDNLSAIIHRSNGTIETSHNYK